MIKVQQAIVIIGFSAVLGTAIYEAQEARKWRKKAAAEAGHADAAKGDAVRGDAEMQRLRQQLQLAKGSVATNPLSPSPFTSTMGVVYGLKQKLKEMPDKNIPEMGYLDDDQLLRIISGPGMAMPGPHHRNPGAFEVDFGNEESVRRALATLRREAKLQMVSRIKNALQSYVKDQQGELPSDVAQLEPYLRGGPSSAAMIAPPRPQFGPDGKFRGMAQPIAAMLPPIDAATLQRYTMTETGNVSHLRPGQYVVKEKAPVDAEYDHLVQIGLGGYLTSGVGKLSGATGWSGEADLAGLTPAQKAAYERSQENRRRAEALKTNTNR